MMNYFVIFRGDSTYRYSTIFIIFLFSLFLFPSCDSDVKQDRQLSGKHLLPELSIVGLNGSMSDSSLIVGKITSPFADKYNPKGQQSYYDFPKGLLIERYDKKTRIASSIKAEYAKYYLDDRKWVFLKHVVGCNDQKDTLNTEQLIWDDKNAKIYSQEMIQFKQGGQVVKSKGFQSDPNFKNAMFFNIKALIYVNVSQ